MIKGVKEAKMLEQNDMQDDRKEKAARVQRAFAAAAERLQARHDVSDLELGRGLVALGLSLWSRAATGEELVIALANLTTQLGEAAGVDLNEDAQEKPVRH